MIVFLNILNPFFLSSVIREFTLIFLGFKTFLSNYYKTKYEVIGLLNLKEVYDDSSQKKLFDHFFTQVQVLRYEKKTLEAKDTYELSNIVGLFSQENTSVVLEGFAGCGKSTLCKYFAREQFFDKRFQCVIMIELLTLRQLFYRKEKEINIESILVDYFHYIKNNLDIIIRDLLICKNEVLWIFDGYDEVEISGKNDNFTLFLDKLINNGFEWLSHYIISSREDRMVPLYDFVHLKLQPWKKDEILSYVQRFFDGKNPDLQLKIEGLLGREEILKFAGMSIIFFFRCKRKKERKYMLRARNIYKFLETPLFCEILCTISANLETGLLLLTDVYRHFFEWVFSRYTHFI